MKGYFPEKKMAQTKLVVYQSLVSQPTLFMPHQLDIGWDAFVVLDTPRLGKLEIVTEYHYTLLGDLP